jgi:NACalpha-BTF3-like transcription factor
MEHLGNLNKPLALLLVNPTYQTKLSDKLKILEEVGINNSEVAEAMRIVVAEAKTAVDTEAPTVEVMDSEGKIEVASEVETEVAFIKINSNSNKCTARMHLAVASSSELIKIHLT